MKLAPVTLVLAIMCGLGGYSNAASANDDYVCGYESYIANADKYNSAGVDIATDSNLQSVAAVLQQNRANVFDVTNKEHSDNEKDCFFSSYRTRSQIYELLANGYVSEEDMDSIIYDNPYVSVDIYEDRINVSVIRD